MSEQLQPWPSSTKPLLVGEDNPYGADPYFALYPKPEHASGGRLCHLVFGLRFAKTYLDHFDRVNLCDGRWSIVEARKRAAAIQEEFHGGQGRPGAVLLGAKVAAAVGFVFRDVVWTSAPSRFIGVDLQLYFLPHPSGRNTVWNEPWAFERARALVAPLLPKAAA